MKMQRKELTEEQIKAICEKNTERYDGGIYCKDACPLKTKIDEQYFCIEDIKRLEYESYYQEIKAYWEKEVEVNE